MKKNSPDKRLSNFSYYVTSPLLAPVLYPVCQSPCLLISICHILSQYIPQIFIKGTIFRENSTHHFDRYLPRTLKLRRAHSVWNLPLMKVRQNRARLSMFYDPSDSKSVCVIRNQDLYSVFVYQRENECCCHSITYEMFD